MNDFESDSPPPVRRPEKNINVFISDENIGVFPPGIFDGEMGPLPLLISVNVGYDPEEEDPFMHYYESQEIMFAYKKDAQERVLMTDSHGRTLSLPLHSALPFHVCSDYKEMKMAEIVSSHGLPVSVQFARAESLDIIVDGRAADHSFFGSLEVTAIYEEPYMWCLAVEGNGKTGDKPIVLPRNLMSAGFCPVVGIRGVNDPAAKVKEFVAMYSQRASQLDFQGDPFFQELAFVSRDPAKPVEKVEPYIDNTTFIPIHVGRRPLPSIPLGERPPPLPPRTPLHPQKPSAVEETSPYSGVSVRDTDEHIYSEMRDEGIKSHSKTNMVTPLQKLSMDSHKGKTLPLPDKTSSGRPLMKPAGDGKAPAAIPARPPHHPERKSSSDKGRGVSQLLSGVNMMTKPPLLSRIVPHHLSALSVEDVAVKLKELGLEKYAKKFRKNRIDGTILQKLSEKPDHLKTEFGMTHTETLLLQTFVTEGHIPAMSKSKSAAGKPSPRH